MNYIYLKGIYDRPTVESESARLQVHVNVLASQIMHVFLAIISTCDKIVCYVQ